MKPFLLTMALSMILLATACTIRPAPNPASTPPASLPSPVTTRLPATPTSAPLEPTQRLNGYTNNQFGLEFQYPAAWFGPDEYVSDNTLRLQVGSDVVYPYGQPPEQPSPVRNSYYVTIQYTLNDQAHVWNDTYQSLAGMNDGESLSGTRSMLIRVRQVNIGDLSGFEYIATLSETAQTEAVYSREVLLMNEQGDLLTVSGAPNNVEIAPGASWREAYRLIDQANQAAFRAIVDSIVIKR
jgi:hypothetical protein